MDLGKSDGPQNPARIEKKSERHRVNAKITIYKNVDQSPFWQIDYSTNGRQIRHTLKTDNKKQAIQLAEKEYKDILLGKIYGGCQTAKVSDAICRFLDHREVKRKCANSTLEAYLRRLSGFEAFLLSKNVRNVDAVTTELLEQYEHQLRTSGPKRPKTSKRKVRPCSENTLHDNLTAALSLLRFSAQRGWARTEAFSAYEMPKSQQMQAHCWSPSELSALLAAMPAEWLDIMNFLRLTGLRSNELCWLLKKDADLEQQILRVGKKNAPNGTESWKPKNGKDRLIPLCNEAVEIARRRVAKSDGPWMFPVHSRLGSNERRLKPSQVRYRVKQAMVKAGLSLGCTHTFRHVFCSFMANQGVPALLAMKIMGHSSMDIVMTYYHVEKLDLTRAISGIDFTMMLVRDSGDHKDAAVATTAA